MINSITIMIILKNPPRGNLLLFGELYHRNIVLSNSH